MNRLLLTAAVTVGLCQAAALAQEDTYAGQPVGGDQMAGLGPEQGDWELTLGGGGTNDQDWEAGAFNLNGSLGYFLTEQWQVSLRQDLAWADSGGDSAWNAGTRLAVDYHFDLEAFRPFVGANIGAFYGDEVDETGAAGLEAGLKYYVKDDTFLFGRGEYQWLFDDASDADNNFDDGRFIYTIGIGFNF